MTSTRSVATTSAPPSRWAVWAAWAVPLCVLPSALWRLTVIGSDHVPADNLYYAALSVISLGLACLTLGLVQPWGERVPRWVPLVGGWSVPPRTTVAVAVAGAVAILALSVFAIYNWFTLDAIPAERVGPDGDDRPLSQRPEASWVAGTYAPILAWPPLLVAVALDYLRRRVRR